jgi:hypothetical protein
MTIEDKEIIVVLPLKTWRTVVAYLEGGVHRDVNPILLSIYAQVNPQAIAAEKDATERAAAELAQADLHAKEATPAAAPLPNGAADDSSDSSPVSHPQSLH